MISERIGNLVRHRLLVIGRALAKMGFTPNLLTIIGVLLNLVVAIIIATGHPQIGGFLLLVASAFDMLDGAVARATGMSSDFGRFLDSTLDRYSEAIVYGGVLIYLLDTDDAEPGAILRLRGGGRRLADQLCPGPGRGGRIQGICRIGGSSGARDPARARSLIGKPIWALWILAFATHLTALTRIVHVWRASLAKSTPDPVR